MHTSDQGMQPGRCIHQFMLKLDGFCDVSQVNVEVALLFDRHERRMKDLVAQRKFLFIIIVAIRFEPQIDRSPKRKV
jgi:hypothetical protein